MRLKYIESVNFGASELTNYRALAKRNKWSLAKGEVACLVSLTGNQIVFVYAPTSGAAGEVLRSERVRLTSRGRWNPLMLADYAEEVGLHLDGIAKFGEHYKRLWKQEP